MTSIPRPSRSAKSKALANMATQAQKRPAKTGGATPKRARASENPSKTKATKPKADAKRKAKAASLWDALDLKEFTPFKTSKKGNNYILKATVPASLRIGKNAYGNAIFVTEDIKAGTVIYRGGAVKIPDVEEKFQIIAKHSDGTEQTVLADTGTHSVLVHATNAFPECRHLYGFDAFMNHSCEPNSHSANEVETSSWSMYDTVASRDIKAGEELTCDYNLFEWDCQDKGIDVCECGSSKCLGKAHGFRWVPVERQKELLPLIWSRVRYSYDQEKGNHISA